MTTGRWNPMGQRFEPDSTPSLAEFLLARFAEDEERARAARGYQTGSRYEGQPPDWQLHIERWSPAMVLADLDAKRRIVELHPSEDEWRDEGEQGSEYCVENPAWTTWTEVLKLLALPYADHLDYRQEWRP